jgi:mannose/cellobiose epimerase-like protein (N-acyl-D-glucosamine 2-epimerase family)
MLPDMETRFQVGFDLFACGRARRGHSSKIKALDRAIELRPGDGVHRFRRGRVLDARRGTLADASADLYDTAFVLFALAEAARGPLSPAVPIAAAQQILGALVRLARDAVHGGYAEALPAPATRRSTASSCGSR